MCRGAITGTTEVCDNVDNDCDGTTDEGCDCVNGEEKACGSNVGACQKGTQTCTSGTWDDCQGATAPILEACDTVDNDCDGEVDEGCDCTDGATQSCGTNTGACSTGTQTCSLGAWGPCENADQPSAEICDNIDNDCDGSKDEDLTQQCGNSDVGACSYGTQTCSSGSWSTCQNAVSPTDETCDDVDNDCDGSVDENLTQQCGKTDVGACTYGTKTCSGGSWSTCDGNIDPAASESCDGVDNTCEGKVDEGCSCTNGTTQTCGTNTGACSTGTQECTGGTWTACSGGTTPTTEVCDDVDNDCDGTTDDGCDDDNDGYCDATMTINGSPAVCRLGVDDCNDTEPTVHPNAAPACDGLDNDCDNTVDEVEYSGRTQTFTYPKVEDSGPNSYDWNARVTGADDGFCVALYDPSDGELRLAKIHADGTEETFWRDYAGTKTRRLLDIGWDGENCAALLAAEGNEINVIRWKPGDNIQSVELPITAADGLYNSTLPLRRSAAIYSASYKLCSSCAQTSRWVVASEEQTSNGMRVSVLTLASNFSRSATPSGPHVVANLPYGATEVEVGPLAAHPQDFMVVLNVQENTIDHSFRFFTGELDGTNPPTITEQTNMKLNDGDSNRMALEEIGGQVHFARVDYVADTYVVQPIAEVSGDWYLGFSGRLSIPDVPHYDSRDLFAPAPVMASGVRGWFLDDSGDTIQEMENVSFGIDFNEVSFTPAGSPPMRHMLGIRGASHATEVVWLSEESPYTLQYEQFACY